MNFTTYYTRGQRVFLINVSAGRDESLFEAFSATIISLDDRQFELRPRYALNHGEEGKLKPGMRFKVTAESYGSGVQCIGSIGSVSGSSFTLYPDDLIEMYQRGQVPRIDLVCRFRTFTRTAPLALFAREWRNFVQGLAAPGMPERLEMQPGQINIGMGGMRYLTESVEPQTELAVVFIELEKDRPPVCAVAELMWRRTLPDQEGTAIGRRFVLIRKEDQERIEQFITTHQKKQRKKIVPAKTNWELLDRMFHLK